MEIECECHGHRLHIEKDEDAVYMAIAERKRGRPTWHEVVIPRDKVEKLIRYLKYGKRK